MNVTIKKIAELANVSRGTVDKVLNNRPGVKEETKNKVLAIAKALNYQPNILGKALVNSHTPIMIGVILTPEYNLFVKDIIKGIEQANAEFSAFGIKVFIQMLTTLEPAEQISILDDMEKKGFSGIAVLPLDNEQVKSKINSLINSGIAIITFNSKINGTNDFCFVGQNHFKGGMTAGGLMGRLLPHGKKIGVIISSKNLSCHQDRLSGFTQKLNENYPHLDIVEIKESQDKTEYAFQIALNYCNKYSDLDGIYNTGGGIMGVANALRIAQRANQIKVICHDFVPDTLELLKEGIVDFAIGQSPELQGYQLVKLLFEYIVKKQKPEKYYIEIPIYVATEDNL